jgi:hypothetical protein
MRFLLALVCVLSSVSQAAPRDYAFAWSTNLAQPKATQLEVWLTPRVLRASEGFFLLESKVVASVGLTQYLDAQFSFDANFQGDTNQDTSLNPALSGLVRFAPLKNTQSLGLGIIAAFTASPHFLQLEARGILDKAFGRLLLSLNIDIQRRLLLAQSAVALNIVEGNAGARFQINPQVRVGLEGMTRTALTGAYRGTGVYLGPSVTADFSGWYFSAGLMSQVGADKVERERGNGEPLTLFDNERFWFRLILGLKAKP